VVHVTETGRTTDALPVDRVGVVGGGTMGAGIVHALLAAGTPVVLVEADERAVETAVGRVRTSLQGAERRGKLSGTVDDVLAGLTAATGPDALAESDLVIEAVPESPELKRRLLPGVEAVLRPSAVLATNTSSLSIDGLGEALARPERFVGMHFFNPVPASALVEVVRGAATLPEVTGAAHDVARRLGKQSVEVADRPGFATSRLGVLVGLEAIRMVEEGVASPEDIDTAMVLGYKHPMGPLRLGDLVGLDVRLGIAEYLAGELGERFEPPALLRQMVAEGRLGKKAGQGFYTWD
jgi:3-hydroxybutyryl-CoA dehydrogenase